MRILIDINERIKRMRKKEWKRLSYSEIEAIRALRLQGLVYTAIAEITGRSLGTCWRYRPKYRRRKALN
jgi:DNA-directed RNA polymerase specialized sigma24 family protein